MGREVGNGEGRLDQGEGVNCVYSCWNCFLLWHRFSGMCMAVAVSLLLECVDGLSCRA